MGIIGAIIIFVIIIVVWMGLTQTDGALGDIANILLWFARTILPVLALIFIVYMVFFNAFE